MTDSSRPRKVELSDILERSNMEEALRHVTHKKSSPGFDRLTVDQLPGYWKEHGDRICQEIRRTEYRPFPFFPISIRKPAGREKRKIELPSVADRMILYAIYTVLSRYYEPGFLSESFGFRPGKSCHDALDECLKRLNSSDTQYIIDLDIRHFFDTVDHNILLSILKRDIKSREVIILLERYIKPLLIRGPNTCRKKRGLSQGSALSPLLANVYLHELDCFMKSQGMSFVRYADDVVVFCKSRLEAWQQLSLCREFLNKCLNLQVNEEKTQVAHPWEVCYLGHSFVQDFIDAMSDGKVEVTGRYQLVLTEKTKGRMLHNMKKTIMNYYKDSTDFWCRLGAFNRGWINYYRKSHPVEMLHFLQRAERHQVSIIRQKIEFFKEKEAVKLLMAVYKCPDYYSLMGWYQLRCLKDEMVMKRMVRMIMTTNNSFWRSGEFYQYKQQLLSMWDSVSIKPFYYSKPSSAKIFYQKNHETPVDQTELENLDKLVVGILAAGKNMTMGQIAGYITLCCGLEASEKLGDAIEKLHQRRLIDISYIYETGYDITDESEEAKERQLRCYRLNPLSRELAVGISAPTDCFGSLRKIGNKNFLKYLFYKGTIAFNQVILNFIAFMPKMRYFQIDQLCPDKLGKVVSIPLYIATKAGDYYFNYIEYGAEKIIYQAIRNWRHVIERKKRFSNLVLLASSPRTKEYIRRVLISDKELHNLAYQDSIFISTADSWFRHERGELLALRAVLELSSLSSPKDGIIR